MRLGEFYQDAVVGECGHGRAPRLFGVTQTDSSFKGLVGKLSCKISAVFRVNTGSVKLVFAAENYVSAFGVDMADVKR